MYKQKERRESMLYKNNIHMLFGNSVIENLFQGLTMKALSDINKN